MFRNLESPRCRSRAKSTPAIPTYRTPHASMWRLGKNWEAGSRVAAACT